MSFAHAAYWALISIAGPASTDTDSDNEEDSSKLLYGHQVEVFNEFVSLYSIFKSRKQVEPPLNANGRLPLLNDPFVGLRGNMDAHLLSNLVAAKGGISTMLFVHRFQCNAELENAQAPPIVGDGEEKALEVEGEASEAMGFIEATEAVLVERRQREVKNLCCTLYWSPSHHMWWWLFVLHPHHLRHVCPVPSVSSCGT